MTIIGVNITKIEAERNVDSTAQKVGIDNNVTIKEVRERDVTLGKSKQKGLRFVFSFTCKYTPDLGHINLEGDVLYLGEESESNKITKEWQDKKRLPADFAEPVLNAALAKCNIQAIKISQDMSMPSPIPLPKVERKKEK